MAINVIYDENKAVQKKKEIDDALPGENKKARLHNAAWIIPAVLLNVLITTLWVWSMVKSNWFDDVVLLVLLSLAVPCTFVLFAGIVLSDKLEPTFKPGENYPALVLYYQATLGKNVLEQELVSCQDDLWNKKAYKLKLVLENEDHSVSQYTLPAQFSIQSHTDVAAYTVDLEKQVIYVPYKIKENDN